MKLKINGKNEDIPDKKNLSELILHKSLVPDHIVVEHNLRIVPKDEWGNTVLSDNDTIEIVSFVGGG